jgi:peptidyl-prolyl cis-trans isomerase C
MIVFLLLSGSFAFHISKSTCSRFIQRPVSMNFFEKMLGAMNPAPKPTAAARHILMKGIKGKEFLVSLKSELEGSTNVENAFADAAAKYSSCPSSKKGGSLGEFKQGAMVPAFDKVVFNEEVGKIHGPVETPFGAHLIYIQDRFEP